MQAWLLRACSYLFHISPRDSAPQPVPVRFHHPIEQLFMQALQSPTPKVWVHWGAFESGKSTAARNAVAALCSISSKSVHLMHGHHYHHETEPLSSLRQARSCMAVVLDHCDYYLRQTSEETVADARALGVNVLLIVTSWERAVELRQHGAELVGTPGCGRWTPAQLEQAITVDDVPQRERLRICTISQTPCGLLDRLRVRIVRYEEQRARLVAREWENGIRALTTSMSTDNDAKGRFPDKDGQFHWDETI